MKRTLAIAFLVATLLAAGCAPSESQIATAIANTQTAAPTATPTITPTPTRTPVPTPRSTPTLSASEMQFLCDLAWQQSPGVGVLDIYSVIEMLLNTKMLPGTTGEILQDCLNQGWRPPELRATDAAQ